MNRAIKIRNATLDEAQQLSALALRSKSHWEYSEEMVRSFEAELTIPPNQIESDDFDYFVAEDSSAVLGFYALERESSTQFELEALFVDPEYIGKGIGRQLMQHAIENVKAKGGKSLVIQGDPNAESFYQAAGGKQIGDRESGSVSGRFLPLFEIEIQ
jgi:N-acetylglutamate synthase-like GNAT family acetyltransferase